MSTYRWIITKDYEGGTGYPEGTYLNAKGLVGPEDADDSISDNMARFSMYTDDKEILYTGKIYGDYSGFEPLDDFGTPNSGATLIKLDGEWL